MSAAPDPLDWMNAAECRGGDPELFFPHPTDRGETGLAYCNGCAVRAECLAFARATQQQGIWGGARLYPDNNTPPPTHAYRDRRVADEDLVVQLVHDLENATVTDIKNLAQFTDDRARRILNGLVEQHRLDLIVPGSKGTAAVYGPAVSP